MQKKLFFIIVAAVALAVTAGCSKAYESKKSVGGLNITLQADRYPLVKGDNKLGVKVTDAAGKTVTDATVEARVYMPPMPGMAPMESTTQAKLRGDSYVFTASPAMEGGWKIDATVSQQGKPPVTTTFNVDAR